MRRIQTLNREIDKFGPGKDGFRSAVPGVSQPTYLSPDFFNAVQESIVRLIESTGLVPSDDHHQLTEGVQRMVAVVYDRLADTVGAALVGIGSRTLEDLARDQVNPFTYMTAAQIANVKSGAGTVDVSDALQTALDTGLDVYLHDGEYLAAASLSGKGQAINGPGRIKTLKEPTIPTSVAASVAGIDDRATTRMIYVEAAWDLQDMLTIKSLGYNCIVHYGTWANGKPGEVAGTWGKMLANAKTAGLDVMMGTEWLGATAATATAIGDAAGSPVVAYVMYDEPIPRGIDKAAQVEKLAAFRAATKKPLGVTENFQKGIVHDNAASTYDFVFLHIYPDAVYNTMPAAKAVALHGIGEAAVKVPNAKIIATVGLLEYTGWPTTITAEFAAQYAKTSKDGSYGVFVWDGYGDAGIINSVRRSAAYRQLSRDLYQNSRVGNRYKVETIAWGGDVQNLPLGAIKKAHLPADSTPGAQVFSVTDVGSYVDSRHATFNVRAISFPGLGGFFATNIASNGFVYFRGYAGNSEVAAQMDFSLLSTPSDWAGEVKNRGSRVDLMSYDLNGFIVYNDIPKDEVIGLSMTYSVAPARDPWRFLGGLLVNTDWV